MGRRRYLPEAGRRGGRTRIPAGPTGGLRPLRPQILAGRPPDPGADPGLAVAVIPPVDGGVARLRQQENRGIERASLRDKSSTASDRSVIDPRKREVVDS